MGCGEWDTNSFIRYSTSKGLATDSLGFVTSSVSNQEMFKARSLDPVLDPKNVIRECCDSEDHPNTLPVETYLSKGSSGGCNQFMIGLSRMISLAARGGIDIYSIIDQLKSSGTCPSYAVRTATKHDTSKGSCCPVAIGNALIDMYKEMQDEISDDLEEIIDTPKQPKKKIIVDKSKTAKCPQCGGNLVFEGGCNTCKDCGWSKCD